MLITASEIIKKSWETYYQNWKKFIPYMILMFVPSVILVFIGVFGLQIEQFISRGSLVFLNNLLITAINVAILLFILWTTIALTKNLRQIIEKKEIVGLKQIFTQTSKYLWPIIWSSFLMVLAVLGGFVMLFIPALIFAIWFVYIFYTVIFEDKKGISSLKASRELVVGRWWKTLWLILVPSFFFGIIILIVQNAFITPLSILLEKTSLTYIFLRAFIINIISAISTPLSALPMIYLYFSVKENPVEKIPETPDKI